MPMVFVRYGGNQEVVLNSNCLAPVFLDHLKKVSGMEASLSSKENLDLASETGEIVDLPNRGKEYARRYMEPRGTFFVVKVVTENDEQPVYIPTVDVSERVKAALSNPKKKKAMETLGPGLDSAATSSSTNLHDAPATGAQTGKKAAKGKQQAADDASGKKPGATGGDKAQAKKKA